MPNFGVPFHIPSIRGKQYAPGPQPNAPGESHLPYAGHMGRRFQRDPWPNAVPVINALANFAGQPRMRGLQIVNNQTALLPSDYLWLNGVVQKSQG